MKFLTLSILTATTLMAGNFTLESNDVEGQLTKVQEFNGFGCSGENKSPELHWHDAPKGTKSFAITIYALDTDKLEVTNKSDSALVGFMINSHTIEKSSMVSYYKR